MAGVSLAHHSSLLSRGSKAPQPRSCSPGRPLAPLRSLLCLSLSRNGPHVCIFISCPESRGHRDHASVPFPHCGKTCVHVCGSVCSLPCLPGSARMRRQLSSPSCSRVEIKGSWYQPCEPSRVLVPLGACVAGAVGASGLGGSMGRQRGEQPRGDRTPQGHVWSGRTRQGPGPRPDTRSRWSGHLGGARTQLVKPWEQ